MLLLYQTIEGANLDYTTLSSPNKPRPIKKRLAPSPKNQGLNQDQAHPGPNLSHDHM